MPPESALPLRMLRRGLSAASRAGASVVERVLRNDARPGPPPEVPSGLGTFRLRRAAAPEGRTVLVRFGDRAPAEVRSGTTVLDAARQAGVDLRHYCGGNCSCGTCRVEIVRGDRNLSRRQGMEEMVLGAEKVARGDRLACQAQVLGEVQIRIPDWF